MKTKHQDAVLIIHILHPAKPPLCDKAQSWIRIITKTKRGKNASYRNFEVLGELTAPQAGQVKV